MDNVVLHLLDELKKANDLYLQQLKNAKDKKPQHKSIETKDLYAALAKAQAEIQNASLNASNPYFKTRYTDLAEIVRVSRPALTKHGLSVTQQIISDDSGANTLITTLAHSSGQYVESSVRILPPKSDVQTLGSYISYLRRYSLASLICVVSSDEDDDAETVLADQRALLAKGPAINAYKPKEQPYEAITKEQLIELELELADVPDLAEEIMEKLQIQSLADMRKTNYSSAIRRIREIKQQRATAK